MTHEKRPARRTWALAGAAAATAALVVAGGASLLTQGGAESAPADSTIDQVMPANADTAVIAPPGADWWPKVSAMASPAIRLEALDLATAGVEVTHVGYSRADDTSERIAEEGTPVDFGPLRLLYLETADDGAAEDLAEFMLEAAVNTGARVQVEGSIVIVAPSWADEYAAPADGESLAGKADLGGQLSAGQAAMWFDPDAEVASLARTPEAVEHYEGVVRRALGFQEGTTWIGTSADGDSWEGKFETGGIDTSQIDFEAVESDLSETETEVSKTVMGETTFQVILGGMADLTVAGGFASATEDRAMGSDPAGRSFQAVQGEQVSSFGDMTEWNAAVEGATTGQREAVTSRYISANEEEMILSFDYADTVS